MVDLDVVRVFARPDKTGGSPLGVVLDGGSVPDTTERQAIARRLGLSETVFVTDATLGKVDIYTPSAQLPFAGYPLVGTAWVLQEHGVSVDVLRTRAGDVKTWVDGEITWIRGRAEWIEGKRTQQFASVAEVNALPAPPEGEGWLYAWAWQSEPAGAIRARGFPRRGDVIVEDEATGAAAMLLAAELGRDLRISQGKGSEIVVRVSDEGWIELGGRVVGDGARPLGRS
jgi:predicted PhzF superfamily epimerase YddE/YHI9